MGRVETVRNAICTIVYILGLSNFTSKIMYGVVGVKQCSMPLGHPSVTFWLSFFFLSFAYVLRCCKKEMNAVLFKAMFFQFAIPRNLFVTFFPRELYGIYLTLNNLLSEWGGPKFTVDTVAGGDKFVILWGGVMVERRSLQMWTNLPCI